MARSSKKKGAIAGDPAQWASAVTSALTGLPPPTGVVAGLHKRRVAVEAKAKNPAAVALGRLGGLKGGRARAESLSAAKRKEIAAKAAKARWGATREEKIKRLVANGKSAAEIEKLFGLRKGELTRKHFRIHGKLLTKPERTPKSSVNARAI